MPRAVAAILRHAHYEQPEGVPSAFLPHPLTDTGRKQARESADRILAFAEEEGMTIHPVVDTSRMLRAWETGTIIAKRLEQLTGTEYEVEEFDALAERSVGAAANLTLDEIARVIERDPRYAALEEGWKATADFRLPLQGAESLREAGVRIAAHLEQRMNKIVHEVTKDALKLFVGHGAGFRYAAVKLDVLTDEQAPKLSMFHCVPVYLERFSKDDWRQVGGEWKVRSQHQQAMD